MIGRRWRESAFDPDSKIRTDGWAEMHANCYPRIMASLIDGIDVKRKTFFEFENTPFVCLDAEVNAPTARGGQTLVRLKMRNLLTRAVFDKTFKASDKFKDPDLEQVPASYL